MNREAFLRRIRETAAAGRRYRVHAQRDLPPGAGHVGGGDDPIQRLVDEAAAVGGQACVVADEGAARERLKALLAERSPRSAILWEHPLLERLSVAEVLREFGVEAWSRQRLAALSPGERREQILRADIGISSVGLAIAETGSLVMLHGPGAERVVSLLPPMHVAFVEQAQVVGDLFDLFQFLAERGLDNLPSNVTLITGPSKSGDIELKLTTGVHGPGAWHVIAIRG